MGLKTFAFGMGGPVATFAAMLHMTVHSLTKSAIFFAVGHAVQKAGTQQMENIRGMIQISPTVGWGLMLGVFAILGMPPFGVFASEFLIITTAMHDHPWATPILLMSLGIAFASVFGKVQPIVSVQNRCSLFNKRDFHNGLVDLCAEQGVSYIAHSPVGGHFGHTRLAAHAEIGTLAARLGVSAYRVALAWLMQKGSHILPIPGASKVASIIDSLRSVAVSLSAADMAAVDRLPDL